MSLEIVLWWRGACVCALTDVDEGSALIKLLDGGELESQLERGLLLGANLAQQTGRCGRTRSPSGEISLGSSGGGDLRAGSKTKISHLMKNGAFLLKLY